MLYASILHEKNQCTCIDKKNYLKEILCHENSKICCLEHCHGAFDTKNIYHGFYIGN